MTGAHWVESVWTSAGVCALCIGIARGRLDTYVPWLRVMPWQRQATFACWLLFASMVLGGVALVLELVDTPRDDES
jgi:hypothetical protein